MYGHTHATKPSTFPDVYIFNQGFVATESARALPLELDLVPSRWEGRWGSEPAAAGRVPAAAESSGAGHFPAGAARMQQHRVGGLHVGKLDERSAAQFKNRSSCSAVTSKSLFVAW